jgi:two-component system LytT family response regulator
MKLTFKTKDKLHVVSADEILICEVVGNYSRLVLNDKKIIIHIPLKRLMLLLPNDTFFRCHSSFIINLNKVSEFNLSTNKVLINNKIIVPVSLRCRQNLFKTLINILH